MATVTISQRCHTDALQSLPANSSYDAESRLDSNVPEEKKFAVARQGSNICLVQLTNNLEIIIFRHEFATMFQYSHQTSVHANNGNTSGNSIRILEYLDSDRVFCEQSGVVFVTADVRDKLIGWTRKIAIPMTRMSTSTPRRSIRLR